MVTGGQLDGTRSAEVDNKLYHDNLFDYKVD